MKTIKTIKIIIYSLSGLLAAGLVFFIFSFLYTTLETKSAQSVQSRLEAQIKSEQDWRQQKEDWNKIEETFNEFTSKYFMKSEKFNDFKMELQSIAGKNGLGAVQMKYSLKSMYRNVVRTVFELEIAGGYENIKRFIYDVENKDEMILFSEIKLSKDKTGSNRIIGTFVMEAYFVR